MFSKFFNNYLSQKDFYFLLAIIFLLVFMFKNPDIFLLIFASIIFACSLSPLVNKLSTKMSRSKAGIVVISGFILVFLILLVPIFVISAQEISNFTSDFPNYIKQINSTISSSKLLQNFHIQPMNFGSFIDSFAIKTTDVISNITNLIENLSSLFLYLFTFIVFIYFLIVDETKIKNYLVRFFPSEIRETATKISENIFDKLGNYVFAQTIVSGSVWLFMTIGLLIFKIKYAFLLGIICGVLSIIPVVGSAISLIISLIATYQSGFVSLIIVTILYTLSHFFENQIVRPYIYSKFMNIHPIIIFLSLFIGAKYAGVIGVLFGPPFATVLFILIEELYLKKME